jgi:hypothetical protein
VHDFSSLTYVKGKSVNLRNITHNELLN